MQTLTFLRNYQRQIIFHWVYVCSFFLLKKNIEYVHICGVCVSEILVFLRRPSFFFFFFGFVLRRHVCCLLRLPARTCEPFTLVNRSFFLIQWKQETLL